MAGGSRRLVEAAWSNYGVSKVVWLRPHTVLEIATHPARAETIVWLRRKFAEPTASVFTDTKFPSVAQATRRIGVAASVATIAYGGSCAGPEISWSGDPANSQSGRRISNIGRHFWTR